MRDRAIASLGIAAAVAVAVIVTHNGNYLWALLALYLVWGDC